MNENQHIRENAALEKFANNAQGRREVSIPETAEYKFTVKEGSPGVSGANDAPVWLALRLAEEATVQQATEIAFYLNANTNDVSHARL